MYKIECQGIKKFIRGLCTYFSILLILTIQ